MRVLPSAACCMDCIPLRCKGLRAHIVRGRDWRRTGLTFLFVAPPTSRAPRHGLGSRAPFYSSLGPLARTSYVLPRVWQVVSSRKERSNFPFWTSDLWGELLGQLSTNSWYGQGIREDQELFKRNWIGTRNVTDVKSVRKNVNQTREIEAVLYLFNEVASSFLKLC